MRVIVEVIVGIRTSLPSNSQCADAGCNVHDTEDKICELVRDDGRDENEQNARGGDALTS